MWVRNNQTPMGFYREKGLEPFAYCIMTSHVPFIAGEFGLNEFWRHK